MLNEASARVDKIKMGNHITMFEVVKSSTEINMALLRFFTAVEAAPIFDIFLIEETE
jgi:hypothetical protein